MSDRLKRILEGNGPRPTLSGMRDQTYLVRLKHPVGGIQLIAASRFETHDEHLILLGDTT
jgi:hypothetical protein